MPENCNVMIVMMWGRVPVITPDIITEYQAVITDGHHRSGQTPGLLAEKCLLRISIPERERRGVRPNVSGVVRAYLLRLMCQDIHIEARLSASGRG